MKNFFNSMVRTSALALLLSVSGSASAVIYTSCTQYCGTNQNCLTDCGAVGIAAYPHLYHPGVSGAVVKNNTVVKQNIYRGNPARYYGTGVARGARATAGRRR